MKRILSLLFTVFISLNLFATVHSVTTTGFAFSPANITIDVGDTVSWTVAFNHNVVEVDMATYNANGSTSNGGFSFPTLGAGGMHQFNTSGTFYYVCTPHAGGGMKGTITVNAPPPVDGDIDFAVDMRGYLGAQDFVTLGVNVPNANGGWCGNCNPLSDLDGDSIYTGTYTFPLGAQEFKFNIGDWTDQESLTAGDPCVITTSGFTNRIYTVAGDATLDTVCWNSCQVCPAIILPPDSVDITFLVNTANITVDPTGIFLAGGGIFGNPGDNPMIDNGSGVWGITIRKPEGISGNYIFLNGNSGWGAKENLAGLPCADAPNFNDRILPTINNDTTLLTCFETCATDTICPAPTPQVDLTFTVDLSQNPGSYSGISIVGTFNSWDINANPLTNNGSGLWSGTITVNENDSIEYKFIEDGPPSEEVLTAGTPCTKTTGAFTNRFLAYGSTNMIVDTVCWNACSVCPPPPAQVDLTFTVDLTQNPGTYSGISIIGDFNFWDINANPLTNNGSGLWSGTITVNENDSIEYKFSEDGPPSQESLTPGTCTKTTGAFTNRFLAYGSSNMIIDTVCWNSCDACPVVVPGPLTQMDLPVIFDDTATVEYNAIDFDGAITTLASADPAGGTNLVACTKKPASSQPWAGSILATPGAPDQGLATDIPFAAGTMQMTLDVYSPSAGLTVMLKVEDENNGGIFAEAQATTTAAGSWETLTFDYSAPTGGSINLANSYNKAVVFFNFLNGSPAAGDTLFYWDNLMMAAPIPLAQMDLPVTFDDITVYDYNAIDFDGAITTLASTDPAGGANLVACTKKPASSQPWAGSILATPGAPDQGFATDIPFAAGDMEMTLDVYSPSAGLTVMLKVEDENNGGIFAEAQATTTAAGSWETLTFDYSAPTGGSINLANSYNKAVVFFNFLNGSPAAGDTLFYWDNLMMAAPIPLAQMDLPVIFDDTATVEYNAIDFDGAITTLASADPAGGANLVACTKKPASSQPWAGSILATPGAPDQGFATDIPFAAGTMQMTLDVYSPSAGLTVMLKVEDENNGGIFAEAQATTAAAGSWETLTFDYSAPSGGSINLANSYNKAVVFFNFLNGSPAAGDTLFYWDNLMMAAPIPLAQMDLPVIFDDTATVEYNAIDFDGAITTLASADPAGGANLVACTKKPASSQPWAGSILATPGAPDQGFATDIPFAAGDMEMTLDVYSPSVGLTVMLKVEDENNGGIFAEAQATTTAAGSWETLTFDYSAPTGGSINLANSYNKAVVFFNFLNGSPAAGDTLFYWDNLMMAAPIPLAQMDLPVIFDDTATVEYNAIDFDGAITTLASSDPAGGTNLVACTKKPASSQPWAGSILATPGAPDQGFATDIPFAAGDMEMSLNVYSPSAGLTVMLKVEDENNGGIFAEAQATTTAAGSWETLIFDYSAPSGGSINLANSYNKAVVFFNFLNGSPAAGDTLFYWDNLRFGSDFTWNGSTSTDWNTASNWDEGIVPSSTADVTIPDVSAASGNDPIITPMVTLGDVTIDANASMIVNTGIVLGGTFTNNGSVTLASTATGTAYLDDFTNPGASYVGDITVERFVTPGSGLGQRFFGTSVASGPVSGLDMTYASGYPTGAYVTPDVCGVTLALGSAYSNLFHYEQANVPAAGCDQLGWFALAPTTALEVGRGYSGWMNDGSVLSVTGAPNTGNIDFVTSGVSGSGVATADGWHLLSNPYPSPLNANAYISAGFTSPQTYDGGSGPYHGTFNPVLIAGNELAIMQGFYAENTGGSATASVTNADRIASNTTAWFSTSTLLDQMLTINVTGNGYADKTNIFYADNSLVTSSFDDYTDCKKRASDLGQPTIYSSMSNDMMALNGFPTSDMGTSVPFGVAHGTDGNFELSFEGMTDFPANTTMYVEDKQLGVYHNIANGNYAYSALASDNSDRFKLHFVLPVELATLNANCAGDAGKIELVSTNGLANREFVVTEANNTLATGALNTLDVEVAEGTYTVTINDAFGGNQVYTVTVEADEAIEAIYTVSSIDVQVGELVSFNNLTTNATSVEWTIGNITSINGVNNATYTFDEVGTYEIVLNVASDDCADVKAFTVNVSNKSTSISTLAKENAIKVYSDRNVVVLEFLNSFNENAIVEVQNVLGQKVFAGTVDASGTKRLSIKDVTTGHYFVSVKVNGQTMSSKVLLSNN